MNDVCWETLKPPRLLHSEVLIRPLPPTQLDDDDDHHHHYDNGDDGDNDSDNDNGNDVDVDDWKNGKSITPKMPPKHHYHNHCHNLFKVPISTITI